MSTDTLSKIKCGHCKGYHATVSMVRECASVGNAARVFTKEDSVPAARPAHITIQQNKKRDDIPDGHYAIDFAGDIRFYRVRRGTGRWSNMTFVDIQASDDYHPVKNVTQRIAILDRISQGAAEASMLYGRHIGRCGVCRRTLTNAASRAAGIGPVCAEKMGF